MQLYIKISSIRYLIVKQKCQRFNWIYPSQPTFSFINFILRCILLLLKRIGCLCRNTVDISFRNALPFIEKQKLQELGSSYKSQCLLAFNTAFFFNSKQYVNHLRIAKSDIQSHNTVYKTLFLKTNEKDCQQRNSSLIEVGQ